MNVRAYSAFHHFDKRFTSRLQVEKYRDRYRTGRRQKTNEREQTALRQLLSSVGRVPVALDIPSGTGRMFGTLADHADRVILADVSLTMLEVAREDLRGGRGEYLHTSAEAMSLPDDSVDLIFCHRLLPHIYDEALRKKMLLEFARVTRKYVITSFHPPGLRRRLKWLMRCLRGTARRKDQLWSLQQFLAETTECGLRLVGRQALRRFPAAAFLLFERS